MNIEINIAGLGSIGRRHIRSLITLGAKDIVLLHTCKETMPHDEFARYPIETDTHEALNNHKPDAIIITNPTALYLDIANPAAEAGCAILIEMSISDLTD